jgi:hypothetical protein
MTVQAANAADETRMTVDTARRAANDATSYYKRIFRRYLAWFAIMFLWLVTGCGLHLGARRCF